MVGMPGEDKARLETDMIECKATQGVCVSTGSTAGEPKASMLGSDVSWKLFVTSLCPAVTRRQSGSYLSCADGDVAVQSHTLHV